jgi:hypothetical protein
MAYELASSQQLCRLTTTLERVEVCPGRACAFWEPGGAVLAGRCALERLDLAARPELAALLLDLRRELEVADTQAEEKELLRQLHRMLNEETEGE